MGDLIITRGHRIVERIWTIADHADMLLKLFNLGLIDCNLLPLRLSFLDNLLQILVEYLVLVFLDLDIRLELLVVLLGLDLELITDDLCLFDQHIHHYIDLFPYLIGFFLE